MHVISRKALREFARGYKDADEPLTAWYRIMRRTVFPNFGALRATFPTADKVGERFVFNIGGNKYRLVVAIHFKYKKAYIRQVLTHKEYDEGIEP